MNSYQLVKSSIRLLLTSAPNGLTLHQLNSDYQSYHQMKDIPFTDFGHATLLSFLRDMFDILQIHDDSDPLMITARPILSKETLNVKHEPSPPLNPITVVPREKASFPPEENLRVKVFYRKTFSSNPKKMKPVKRLVLGTLSTNTEHCNSSNDHFSSTSRFNQSNFHKNSSENFYSYHLFDIDINRTTKCYIVRYSDGKFYIPCFELAKILNVHEEIIDQETMFSRIRLYRSHDLFHKLEKEDQTCRHRAHRRRPFRFLFLVNSILSLLKTKIYIHRYQHVVSALEKLFH